MENEKRETSKTQVPNGGGLLDAPPKTTFFMGLFLGIAAMSVLGLLLGVGGGNASGSTTKTTGSTNTSAAADTTGTTAGETVAGSIAEPSSATDHWRGVKPENADVVLVEYSDYQRHHPTMQQVLQDYDGKVSWVYRHFPLDSIHPNATPSANAAECVAALAGNDAFWQFTDAMFNSQATLGDALYLAQAKAAGVSESDFESCYSAKQYQSVVTADLNDGTTGGVTGTPGTIVLKGTDVSSGQLISGALPYASVQQVIDSYL
jgi:protein-disulfide isomerase